MYKYLQILLKPRTLCLIQLDINFLSLTSTHFKYACSLYVLDIFVSRLKSLSFNYAMKKKMCPKYKMEDTDKH